MEEIMEARKRALKFNVILIWCFAMILSLNTFFVGTISYGIKVSLITLSTSLVVSMLYFLKINIYVKALLSSMMPFFGGLILSIMVMGQDNTRFFLFYLLSIVLVGIYFNEKLVIFSGIIANTLLVGIYMISHKYIMGDNSNINEFLRRLLIINCGIVVLYFLSKEGNKLLKLYQKRGEELKKSNDELQMTIKKLEESQEQVIQGEKFAVIGELSSSITHEIKNPLGSILTNIQLLKSEIEDFKNLKPSEHNIALESIMEEVEIIEIASKQAKNIAMNILNYSRVNKDEKGKVDIKNPIELAVMMTKKEMQYKGVVLKLELGEGLIINGNVGELTQIMLNLIINARDAVIEKPGKEKYVKIKSYVKEYNVVIEVEDNGVGISEDNKKRIYDNFFTTKEKGKGTGLGMGVVQSIVAKYNGTISLESTLGVGTKFIISFERADLME